MPNKFVIGLVPKGCRGGFVNSLTLFPPRLPELLAKEASIKRKQHKGAEMNNEIYKQLTDLAFKKSKPFCYQCYKEAPTGVCSSCHSDDLMRLVDGVGCEYGTEWIVKHILETELEAIDMEEEFESHIRDCYPEETKVGWMTFDTVKLMKENDPISWDCAKSEWESQFVDDETFITFDNGSNYFKIEDIMELFAD